MSCHKKDPTVLPTKDTLTAIGTRGSYVRETMCPSHRHFEVYMENADLDEFELARTRLLHTASTTLCEILTNPNIVEEMLARSIAGMKIIAIEEAESENPLLDEEDVRRIADRAERAVKRHRDEDANAKKGNSN